MTDSAEFAQVARLRPKQIMEGWRVGSAEHSWLEESRQLWENDRENMAELAASIATIGVQEPVLLGDDGRVWDGHHRIIAAAYSNPSATIPVEHGHGG